MGDLARVATESSERVIVCGRGSGLAGAVAAVRGAGRMAAPRVIVVSEDDPETDPCTVLDVDIVCGSPTSREALESAGVVGALGVLVVGGSGVAAGSCMDPADELALRIAVAVRSLDRHVPICVQSAQNRRRSVLEAAGATLVVSAETVGARLLAQSILDPGSSRVYRRLLGAGRDRTGVFAVTAPDYLEGVGFGDAQRVLVSSGTCLLGWRSQSGPLEVNPDPAARIPEEALLYLVAGCESLALEAVKGAAR